MGVIRISHNKENPYVMLNKHALEDDNISWGAKGLWSYLMSRPDNWNISVSHLSKIYEGKGGGTKSIYAFLDELIEAGYCERSQSKSAKGTFQKTEYTIMELKKCLPLGPPRHAVEPRAVEPRAVQVPTTNKGYIINNEYNEKPLQ